MASESAFNPSPYLTDGSDRLDGIPAMAMQACAYARAAAAASADAIATGKPEMFASVAEYERQLDMIDRDVDDAIVFAISETSVREARALLACMKFVIDLERIGDLIASFASRAAAVRQKLDDEDIRDFIRMTTTLESMLAGAAEALEGRDLNKAIKVLQADAEVDRIRNLIFVRHVGQEREDGRPAKESVQVLFMAHALERAGDHAKNLAEEVCHYVSGRTVRHVLRSKDKPYEQLFIDWLKQKQL